MPNFEERMKGEKHWVKVEVDPLGLQRILVSTFTAAPKPLHQKLRRIENINFSSDSYFSLTEIMFQWSPQRTPQVLKTKAHCE